jgi:arsenite methyltransferase
VSPDAVPPKPFSPATGARAERDPWSDWLLSGRQGGHDLQPDQRAELTRYRDGVLAGAELQAGDILLDVGCGDGLVGFGAFDSLGQDVRVVFSDVSVDLLRRCEGRATEMGVSNRCSFVEARAENLVGVSNRSVDVVTTRSVLIYVERKRDAFAEFFRVLRPGGRLSMMEPINSRMFPEPPNLFFGWDVSVVADLRNKVVAEFDRTLLPGSQAMMDFDENDLVRMAQDVGFEAVELLLHLMVNRPQRLDWERLLHSSPNPLAPTFGEAVSASLDDSEANRFLTALRASVEIGLGQQRLALAYLRAIRAHP